MVTMLRNLINTYTGATPNPSRASLPGPLPHTLTRSSLATLLKNDYWACEKSDGIRTMFLAHGGHAYLVDRCFDFYKLPVCKGVYASLSAQGDVLVDGEIVVSYFDPAVDGDEKQAVKTIKDFADVAAFEAAQKTSRVMFYMFDAVHFGGRSVKDEELTSRLRCLGELRNAQFVACEKLELPKAQLPLTLQTKTFCKSYEYDTEATCRLICTRRHFLLFIFFFFTLQVPVCAQSRPQRR
jgi:ATP-dependent DNA ligase